MKMSAIDLARECVTFPMFSWLRTKQSH